jgi:N utilization substance protein B
MTTARPRSRRVAREVVLQALYEMDVGSHEPADTLERLVQELHVGAELAQFARSLLAGVLDHRAEIDYMIEKRAPAWPTEQLSPVDRNILRIAIRECIVDNLTPVGAAINEAVELAKKYGSDSSSKFVNGVLGAVSAPDRGAAQEGE